MSYTCAFCIRTPTNFFVSTCTRNAVDIASRTRTTPRVVLYSAAFSWGGPRPGSDIHRVSGAGAHEEVGWCSDAECARVAHPIAPSLAARSIPAAGCNRPPRPPRNRPDARRVLRIGNSGTAPEAGGASAVFLRRTWPRPVVWSCHGCACRPSALPSGPDRPALPRDSQSASLGEVFSSCGRPRTPLFLFDLDHGPGKRALPRHSGSGHLDTGD